MNPKQIQEQCWGKPSNVQLDIWKSYGFIPSINGWFYLPWKLK